MASSMDANLGDQRVSSTKTRIKTNSIPVLRTKIWLIKEYHPLKQGLRQDSTKFIRFLEMSIKEYHPLKQGLRLNLDSIINNFIMYQRVSSTKTRIKTSSFSLITSINFVSKSIIH